MVSEAVFLRSSDGVASVARGRFGSYRAFADLVYPFGRLNVSERVSQYARFAGVARPNTGYVSKYPVTRQKPSNRRKVREMA